MYTVKWQLVPMAHHVEGFWVGGFGTVGRSYLRYRSSFVKDDPVKKEMTSIDSAIVIGKRLLLLLCSIP